MEVGPTGLWIRLVERGDEALAAGQVGVVLVAGGQGTRLGFDQPKGMFPIGPVSNRTLFQIFADRLQGRESALRSRSAAVLDDQ